MSTANTLNQSLPVTSALLKSHQLLDLLEQLALLLKHRGYWQDEAPSQQQLASVQPFAIDTLTFPQWLQFIFLVRFKQMLKQPSTLPSTLCIAPMAAQVLPNDVAIFKLLSTIDLLVSE
ncbi:YqcC family protein [Psychromonas sp. SA13A]|uniref:YqcC family protein n=1 Tax=Psychromonas sp. SA13A TaxID=2686346 RepID=UPI00140B0E32|nr:YqcC family protein [Psychromonas sp. SA13A]